MKALFLVFHGFAPHNGISKKIAYQKEALINNGLETELCYTAFDESGNQIRMVDNKILVNYGKGIRAKILKRIDYSEIVNYVSSNNIKYVYMRSDHNANPCTIRLVKRLRRAGAVVDMEIPTYPYDREYEQFGFYDKFTLFIDKLFRRKLASYLHRVVTFTNLEEIFNRKTIQISNGIDFSSIKLRSEVPDSSDAFNLIAVAEIHFWHGFDRVVAGLVNYYRNTPGRNVFLHIVGGGIQAEINLLQRLAIEGGIEDKVIFYGPLWGEELDNSFEKANFAIASLARHRSGINRIKTLKNREYAARGIPFIYSETDEDFDNRPYILKAKADESPIDINTIINFCDSLTVSPEAIRKSIESELSWEKQMKRVVDEIKIR